MKYLDNVIDRPSDLEGFLSFIASHGVAIYIAIALAYAGAIIFGARR